MMDKEFMNFLNEENHYYIIGDFGAREDFTEEYQYKVRMFLRNIILKTELGLLHTED